MHITVSAGGISWPRIAGNISVSAEIHQQGVFSVEHCGDILPLSSGGQSFVQVKFITFLLCLVCFHAG